MRPSFQDIYMRLASSMSERSTCRRLRVGCAIVTPDFRKVLAVGYNGNAAGCDNDCDVHGEAAVGNCGCFVSGTLTTALSVERAYRRWYEGTVVRLVTAYDDFTVTPNHPVLVLGRGWVAAETLQEGDELLHACWDEGVSSAAPHDQKRVPVEQVFESLAIAGRLVRHAGARHQFHGDGVLDQEVEVVSSDCFLRFYEESGFLCLFDQPSLPAALERPPLLGVQGPAHSAIDFARPSGAARSSPLDVENSRLLKTAFDSTTAYVEYSREAVGGFSGVVAAHEVFDGEAQPRGALMPAQVLGHLAKDAVFAQAVLDGRVRDLVPRCQGQNSVPLKVASNKVRLIERKEWAGHVYNLQTRSGWYAAGNAGMVAQNCLHAEENAVINCDVPRDTPKIVFCTHLPCLMCAKRLINLGGVVRVWYAQDYRRKESLELLERVGIIVSRLQSSDHKEFT
jgi:hypothetical protein